jgi:hypothetical protein
MVKLGALIFIAGIVFWLWAIFDSLTSDKQKVRNLPKAIWVGLIVLFFELAPLAALAWVLLGRPRAGAARPGGRTGLRGLGGLGGLGSGGLGSGGAGSGGLGSGGLGSGGLGSGGLGGDVSGDAGGRSSRGRRAKPPIGPDDDPDFLRGL